MKAEVEKLDINKIVDVPPSFNNLKTKVDDLDFGNLKILLDLKYLSNLVDKEVAKNTKLNTLQTKVNSFKNKIPDATTLNQISQYNTEKRIREKYCKC